MHFEELNKNEAAEDGNWEGHKAPTSEGHPEAWQRGRFVSVSFPHPTLRTN